MTQLSIDRVEVPFRAIDQYNTKIREDAFCFLDTAAGFDLHIASPIPQRQTVNDATFDMLLKQMKTRQYKQTQNPYLLGRDECKEECLTTEYYTTAITACYAFSSKDGDVTTAVTLKRVRLNKIFTYLEYAELQESRKNYERLILLLEAVDLLGELSKKAVKYSETVDGIGGKTISSLLSLFNHTCRLAADQLRSPYVGRTPTKDGAVFELGHEKAIFNRSFRDPLSFINAENLRCRLLGKQPLFPRSALKRHLK